MEWKRHKLYTTLDDIRKELKFESNGRAAEFIGEDYQARDFRVSADNPALEARLLSQG